MIAAIVAMLYFRGNFRMTCQFLCKYDDMPHMLITESGQPVQFFLVPGTMSGTAALSRYNLDVPEGSWLTGDKAYTDYPVEDVFHEAGGGTPAHSQDQFPSPTSALLNLSASLGSQNG